MKGDFSRMTFDPLNHFSRVLMQQGRVSVDADWNEQSDILVYTLRMLARDLIGPHGGPTGPLGFKIEPLKTKDFVIVAGRYYADGICCELESFDSQVQVIGNNAVSVEGMMSGGQALKTGEWVRFPAAPPAKQFQQIQEVQSDKVTFEGNVVPAQATVFQSLATYLTQPDYSPETPAPGIYLVFLDVWEEHITHLENPGIREVALGGPDTTTRSRVVWQVKLDTSIPKLSNQKKVSDDEWAAWVTKHESALSNCRMSTRLQPEQKSTAPCILAPTSAYRGEENQLYRVEIHKGGAADEATFKWSRENGSVAALCSEMNDGGGLIVNTSRSFTPGQFVEIISRSMALADNAGEMRTISKVEGNAIYLDSPPTIADKKNPTKIIRRWDQFATDQIKLTDGTLQVTEESWLPLENGIEVRFNKNGAYRTGDYWLIPARTIGTIGWRYATDAEGEQRLDADGNPIPIPQAPFGIVHHYAPLATIKVEDVVTVGDDLRRKFDVLGK